MIDFDIRQLSTHLSNEKKGKDEALDELLLYWGEQRARSLSVLGVGGSPIVAAMTYAKPHIQSDITQPKQTSSIRPKTPLYWKNYRVADINHAVWELQVRHQEMLIRHYEDGWKGKDFVKEFGWEISTYHTRMSEARRAIKKHPTIKKMLGRA